MPDDQDLKELQRAYLLDVEQTVELIREHGQSLAEGSFKTSFPTLLFLTHQLKGSGGSFGFPRITELALAMNRQLNLFLDEQQLDKPTPEQLSSTLILLTQELEREVHSAQRELTSSSRERTS